jgi:iron complex transport system substrate-binding protein
VLFDVDALVAAGPGSFVHELLADAGAENVVDAAPQPFPTVPLEVLVARRPERVLVAPMGPDDAALARLPDALRQRALPLRSPGILRPGPGVKDALEELVRLLDDAAASPAP